jgi:Protein of unknown function (DUF1573)
MAELIFKLPCEDQGFMMNEAIKKLFSLAAAVLISVAGLQPVYAGQAAGAGNTAPTAPKAVVPFDSFSFGDVYKGEVISHIFVIRNEGSADLQIKDFAAGWGCEVTGSDRVIPPGKEGKARLEVNTANQAGKIFKMATLNTNDPERPNIVLSLVANVLTSADGGPVKGVALRAGKHIGPIFLGPDTSRGFNLPVGEKGRTEFTITAEQGPIQIVRIEGGGKNFTSRVETIEQGKSYKLIVEFLPVETAGEFSEQLRIITDSAVLPSFPISVYAIVTKRQW